jgi:hypothetical protein
MCVMNRLPEFCSEVLLSLTLLLLHSFGVCAIIGLVDQRSRLPLFPLLRRCLPVTGLVRPLLLLFLRYFGEPESRRWFWFGFGVREQEAQKVELVFQFHAFLYDSDFLGHRHFLLYPLLVFISDALCEIDFHGGFDFFVLVSQIHLKSNALFLIQLKQGDLPS